MGSLKDIPYHSIESIIEFCLFNETRLQFIKHIKTLKKTIISEWHRNVLSIYLKIFNTRGVISIYESRLWQKKYLYMGRRLHQLPALAYSPDKGKPFSSRLYSQSEVLQPLTEKLGHWGSYNHVF